MEIIDYTKMTKKQNPNVGKCPKCGRKGEVAWYTGKYAGKGRCVHKAELVLMFLTPTDVCFLTKEA